MIDQTDAEQVAIQEALIAACRVNSVYADVVTRARDFLMTVTDLTADQASFLLLEPQAGELQEAVNTLTAIQDAFPHMFRVDWE